MDRGNVSVYSQAIAIHLRCLKLATLEFAHRHCIEPTVQFGRKNSICKSQAQITYYHLISFPYSDIKDVHDNLEICIFSGDKHTELLGRVCIPLLRVNYTVFM